MTAPPREGCGSEDGEPLTPGRVYLAPGGKHLTVVRSGGLHCKLTMQDPVQGHRPSVDVLFESLAVAKSRVCAALMTGMGQDGAQGMLTLRKTGARTIAQDQETSLVYGMPRAPPSKWAPFRSRRRCRRLRAGFSRAVTPGLGHSCIRSPDLALGTSSTQTRRRGLIMVFNSISRS